MQILLATTSTSALAVPGRHQKKIPSESFNCINKELEPIKGIEEEEKSNWRSDWRTWIKIVAHKRQAVCDTEYRKTVWGTKIMATASHWSWAQAKLGSFCSQEFVFFAKTQITRRRRTSPFICSNKFLFYWFESLFQERVLAISDLRQTGSP